MIEQLVIIAVETVCAWFLLDAFWRAAVRFCPPDPPTDDSFEEAVSIQRRIRSDRDRRRRHSDRSADRLYDRRP